jgi:protein TonB
MKKLILLLFIPLVSFGQSETENNSKVPSEIIDNVPVYPGCKGSELKKRKCMSEKIAKFVERKFNTDIAADLGLTGRQRISVIFKIDTLGNITGVRARAPHPRLEKEAVRVINLLPKMKPGIKNGKPVIVPYSIPMIFQVNENKKKKKILKPYYLDW